MSSKADTVPKSVRVQGIQLVVQPSGDVVMPFVEDCCAAVRTPTATCTPCARRSVPDTVAA
jgi:hypothetical protein